MFASFFLAGFECATGYNVHGRWIDQVAATAHDRWMAEDYRLLRTIGIRAAREAIRWPLVDRGRGRYDFSSVAPAIDAAQEAGVELLHDLFHFGYPEGVDPFAPDFAARFADYCYAAGRYVAGRTDGVCTFTPINEPSYFAWAAGEAGLFAPHCRGRGPELKLAVARAAIRGVEAVWDACPRARIVSVDALCRVVAPAGCPDLAAQAVDFNEHVVFEAWDMIAGRRNPELGGSRAHLGVVGVNYYWTNQWEIGRAGVPLRDDDPRRATLHQLVEHVWRRYGGDVLITETGHVGDMRPVWLRELADEAERLLAAGVPLAGVCLYPILGMPEWHAPEVWTPMGLWDVEVDGGSYRRVPHAPAMDALREARERFARLGRDGFRAGQPARSVV